MKRWLRRVAAGLLGLTVVLLADYGLYPICTSVGGQSHNQGRNGLWLRDSWYRGEEGESVASLASRLKAGGFSDAYFHVRFITKRGTLRYQMPKVARQINRQLHASAPGVRSLAWVYIGNERGITGVDLNDEVIRTKIAAQLRELVTSYGFDGVQIDYEICASGDLGLLWLLETCRRQFPRGKILSVASSMWFPWTIRGLSWSDSYFAEVAKRSDQIAVMAYDSGLQSPRAYVWLLKQQARRLPPILTAANPGCQLIIGVPTYEDGGPSHNLWAENLRLALKAVREAYVQPPPNFQGIALFADYSTSADEWQTYHRYWSSTVTRPE